MHALLLCVSRGERPAKRKAEELSSLFASSSELNEEIDGGGQLALLGDVVEGVFVGEVPANLGADAEELAGVVVEADGRLGVVGVDAGAGAVLVAEPFGPQIQVQFLAQVDAVDVPQAPG